MSVSLPPAPPAASEGLPPGPERPPVVQAVAFHRDPLGLLRRCRARYGRVFTLRLAEIGPLVVVGDPDDVAPLLEELDAGGARRRLLPFIAAGSAFGGDGMDWRAARGRVAPLLQPDAVARHREAFGEIARRHALSWPRGRPFRLLTAVKTLLDELFVEQLLGVRSPERRDRIVSGVRTMLWTPGNPPLGLPGRDEKPFDAFGRAVFRLRAAPLRAALADELERRRRQPGAAAGEDLLDAQLADPDGRDLDAMVDETVALLMAAQEPPAVALTWLAMALGRDEASAQRFAEGSGDDEWSRGAIDETLRLWPPASGALRRLAEPAEVAGHRLPAGAVLHLAMPLAQRHPAAWPEPDAFRPERWRGTPRPGTFLPFGGGTRGCLGQPLARTYLQTAGTEIMRHVRLRPVWPGGERMVARATTLVPHRSGLVVAQQP